MFLNSGVGSLEEGKMHGAFSLGASAEPLLDGFRVTIGGNIAKVLALLAVIGLIASFHTIIFAYGRQIYSLSRAGYFPQVLSVTHGAHRTPNRALVAGTVLGFAVMLVVWFVAGAEKGGAFIGGTLLNMAVFGAMISYAMQGLSFILLRVRMPNIARPYRSPLGNLGAAVTIVIALVTLYYQLKDPDLSERRLRGVDLVSRLYPVLRGDRPAQAGAVARRRVRTHQGCSRSSGNGRLRQDDVVESPRECQGFQLFSYPSDN